MLLPRVLAGIAGLFAVLLAAAHATASIFGEDDRLSVAANSPGPYSPIGRVYGAGGSATGFLVSACHALTVQHVIGGGVGSRLHFKAVTANERHTRSTSAATVVMTGDFDDRQLASQPLQGRDRDWALLRLDHCLGRHLGFVELASEKFEAYLFGRPLKSAGFPNDRPGLDTLVLDPECHIRGGNPRDAWHDCAALPGNSGAPLFEEIHTKDGIRLRVVAMVTSGNHGARPLRYQHGLANRATLANVLLRAIQGHPDAVQSASASFAP